jgi:hypothetical protein
MARNYRKYTPEDILKYAKQAKTLGELVSLLGLKSAGGNFCTIRNKLQLLKIECSHWESDDRKAWSRGKQLKDWSQYNRAANLKPHLIKERGHKCENCEMELWLGEKIPLEIHHIDGDRTNNALENLELRCCNCHSLTPTWRNKKRI